MDYPDVEVREEITTRQPAEALLPAAEEADMVAVGTRGRGLVGATLLGSVSHAVAHYAPCPAVVVS
ncbi:universal stress protein [Saccharopolyspora indica]|uniref:universal stress protein n=1 Tax=Saccharopolyspora indica TaxID=1229659 RepID=UPI0022EA9967|nr:universal stress protein [Saccharopolyspora indica]MDA3647114.1 universal stress protein [Saccharopolyspora indica]